MADFALTAQVRALSGKGAARKLRAQGLVPAVLYGNTEKELNLAVPERALNRLLGASLIDLQVEGESQPRPVIIKEIQKDPVSNQLLHVDFMQVRLDQPITTVVPLTLVNEDRRESDGGIVEQILREIEVTCLPTQIPEFIAVDVSGLKINDTLRVADVVAPPGVEVTTDPEEVVVTVAAPAEPVAEETAEEAETADAE
ncbi:MAG: 50S ribosomal protein L25 [Firmicutes bacterium]|nr:50S ribosomal protein L25 [Bacillota bacterium]